MGICRCDPRAQHPGPEYRHPKWFCLFKNSIMLKQRYKLFRFNLICKCNTNGIKRVCKRYGILKKKKKTLGKRSLTDKILVSTIGTWRNK